MITGLHHYAFAVPDLEVADTFLQGFGLETADSNFFHYTRDPWGSWIEWFSDIDQIRDCRVARDWDVPPHLGGSPPPEDFLVNREPTR